MVNNLPTSAGNKRDEGSIPDPLEQKNGNPVQYSCLEDSIDRGAWWATIYGMADKSDVTEHIH